MPLIQFVQRQLTGVLRLASWPSEDDDASVLCSLRAEFASQELRDQLPIGVTHINVFAIFGPDFPFALAAVASDRMSGWETRLPHYLRSRIRHAKLSVVCA